MDNLPQKIKTIYLSKEIDKKLFYKLGKLNKPIIRVDNKKAQAMAKGNNHQGYLMDTLELEFFSYKDLIKKDFLIVLVGLTDMGNIGSIIRTSYALGVDGIIISGIKNIKSDILIRTSSGAAWSIPIATTSNVAELINEFLQSGFFLYGSCLGGNDINTISKQDKKVLFLGNENSGIPNKILNKLYKVSIKMKNNFNSLNVANAAAILIDRIR